MTELLLDRAGIGRWTAPVAFPVTRDAIMAYALASNDDEHIRRGGDIAPPAYAVAAALEALNDASHLVASDTVFADSLHGAQDLHISAPLRPGTIVYTRATARGIVLMRAGTSVVLESETRDAGGTLLNRQYMSLLFPGQTEGTAAGEPAPPHRIDADPSKAAASASLAVDADQTQRFAEASGDHNPMHLDRAYAQAAGFPDVIVHGLCTMAFCGRAVIGIACPGAPERLERLALRFSRPVFPGNELTVQLRPSLASTHLFSFEASTDPSTVVIKDGLAQIAAASG